MKRVTGMCLEHLAITTCVLITHSFAVLIALEFLRQHQDCVEGLVLVSADFDVGRRVSATEVTFYGRASIDAAEH